ncbi:MAG TPA: AbrB/MazE/SpoVT family DNA-binding domain-containing protein [Rhizomicrobium sp.]|jgi:AbrB family looped-hinge helix DNA binding protein
MTTMTSKGQVTVPKKLRDALGLKPGSEVVFEYEGNGRAVIRRAGKRAPPKSVFAKLRGSLKGGLTTDQILDMTRGKDR